MILAMGAILFSAGLAPVWQDTAYAGDGTCGEASADGSTAWYFAEGYTGPGFDEWITIQTGVSEITTPHTHKTPA